MMRAPARLLFGSNWSAANSQPFAVLWSMSAKPPLQLRITASPLTQPPVAFGRLLTLLPGVPQLCESDKRLTSQPFAAAWSTSAQPGLHVTDGVPSAPHTNVPFG